MAKKHFDEYYNKISAQYHEMIDDLDYMEKRCREDVISPEMVETLKQTLEPIKNNYMSISYIKYLLDMPNKKSKQKTYDKNMQRVFDKQQITMNNAAQENTEALLNLEELVNDGK